MNREEQETHIVMNKADAAEGYFRFSTTVKSDYLRLIKRIGGQDKLINLKMATKDADPVEWICKVPIAYFRKTTFGVGKARRISPKAYEHLARIKS